MPFPFVPIGAIVAALILGAALTVFVWALMAIDHAASRAAGSVVSGLVSGFRGWSSPVPRPERAPSRNEDSRDEPAMEPTQAIPVSRVR